LDCNNSILGLDDSKKLSNKQRDLLYNEIIDKSIAYSIQFATVDEIDRLNILQATLLAMQRAIDKLSLLPNIVQIDGNFVPKLNNKNIICEAIIKGDSKVPQISAASILAKVTRDRYMNQLDSIYPDYGFAKHKGYGTKLHLDMIKKYGVLPIHRKSFTPIKNKFQDNLFS
jgi:ribonuclease HII